MKVYIRKSKLHGKGILALHDIKKGEVIFNVKGKKVNFLINNKEKAKIAGFNWMGIGKNCWIDPQGFGLYTNHSCNPNSAVKGKVKIVATRDIKSGEEVTLDYSLTEADIFWKFKCSCKSKNCRGTIKSIQFLPRKLFNKNLPYIPTFFKRVYTKFQIANFSKPKDLEIAWVDFIKKGFSI